MEFELSMFASRAHFADITLSVDPIDRARTNESDNAMAIFYEEQPLMWKFAKDAICQTLRDVSGEIDFLDVGTGSGVWSILVAKHTSARTILALDKSRRAVDIATQNARANGVSFTIKHEFYNTHSAPYRSTKVIGIYAPYHLYPAAAEMRIPQHARGGVDGQQIFKEQLCIANYHLADGGRIIFNQMCLGRNGAPAFVTYIPQLLEGTSLRYTNIFPPIATDDFLSAVYGDTHLSFQRETARQYPELYYCNGIITRDGKGQISEVTHGLPLAGRTWQDRISLHRQIAQHAQ